MRVRFAVNTDHPRAVASRADLAARAAAAGLTVVESGACDVLVTLGGDGTILKAARESPATPVLGFNFGALGYLANVEERDFDRAFELLAAGRWSVRARTMLKVVKCGAPGGRPLPDGGAPGGRPLPDGGASGGRPLPDGGAPGGRPRPDGSVHLALNDVVIVREMTGHAATLDLHVNGCAATRYTADGLVVATPTGSTAYSLSAGGPVLLPDTPCLVVTPMNPHALGVRPLVLSDGVRLTVTSRRRGAGSGERVGVYADGETAFYLDADESAEIVQAAEPASFVELEGFDPYAVMSRKLGWKGSVRS